MTGPQPAVPRQGDVTTDPTDVPSSPNDSGQSGESAALSKPSYELKPEGLTLSEVEMEMLANLQPLVATPRAAKRLVNTYRLIRARLSGPRLKRFKADREFLSVQILLGILSGFPGLASDVFRVLRHTDATSFWEFVDRLEPRIPKGSTSKINHLRPRELTDAEAWSSEQRREALHKLKARINGRGGELQTALESAKTTNMYQEWLDEVARYSFHAGHVVTTLARRG